MTMRGAVKARMTVTKNDLARVIVQALHGLPKLPEADSKAVVKMARCRKDHLERQHKLAVKVLGDVKRISLPLGEEPPGLGWKIVDGNSFMNQWERP